MYQLFKNVASQSIELFAFDYTTGAPKTGDASNITPYYAGDGGSVTGLTDTSATEISSSNAPGWYRFDLTQAETNFDRILFTAKSSTANATLVGAQVSTRPSTGWLAPTVAGRTLDVTATGAAGIDWANIENPTTAVNLSGTNIDPDQVVASVSGAVGSVTAPVTAGTVTDKTGYTLSASGSAALTEGYRANGATGTLAQLLYEIIAHLGESSIAGTVKTINKLDHTTPAEVFTLDDADAPSSVTRAS